LGIFLKNDIFWGKFFKHIYCKSNDLFDDFFQLTNEDILGKHSPTGVGLTCVHVKTSMLVTIGREISYILLTYYIPTCLPIINLEPMSLKEILSIPTIWL